nr:hypothetical protein [Tanacetum cinerariifolium]
MRHYKNQLWSAIIYSKKRTTVFFEEFGCSTRGTRGNKCGGNNFFQEEDQQFFTKNLDAQLEMEERFAVDTLCSLIDFDFPTEQMHNQLPTEPMMPEATVQGRNNVEIAQSIITEFESQDAIHDQFNTLSMKSVDSVQGYNDAKGSLGTSVTTREFSFIKLAVSM